MREASRLLVAYHAPAVLPEEVNDDVLPQPGLPPWRLLHGAEAPGRLRPQAALMRWWKPSPCEGASRLTLQESLE